jgi:hypothetical protein
MSVSGIRTACDEDEVARLTGARPARRPCGSTVTGQPAPGCACGAAWPGPYRGR